MFPGCGQPALREVAHPCDLFDTDSESDPAQRFKDAGRFQAPRPQAPVRYACVQDPSEA